MWHHLKYTWFWEFRTCFKVWSWRNSAFKVQRMLMWKNMKIDGWLFTCELERKLKSNKTSIPRISTYALTMDTPLFHAYPISPHFSRITWLHCMEGTPLMSLSEDETGVKLIIIIIINREPMDFRQKQCNMNQGFSAEVHNLNGKTNNCPDQNVPKIYLYCISVCEKCTAKKCRGDWTNYERQRILRE